MSHVTVVRRSVTWTSARPVAGSTAREHLHDAVANVCGDCTQETRFRYETLRDTLRDDERGVDKAIRALKHLAATHSRKEVVRRELAYFRKNRKRMNYADLKTKGFMIGSGVVEVACKTVVTQRLKPSGKRWSVSGAGDPHASRMGPERSLRQGVGPRRHLVGSTFYADVTVIANVVALKPETAPRKPRAKASR